MSLHTYMPILVYQHLYYAMNYVQGITELKHSPFINASHDNSTHASFAVTGKVPGCRGGDGSGCLATAASVASRGCKGPVSSGEECSIGLLKRMTGSGAVMETATSAQPDCVQLWRREEGTESWQKGSRDWDMHCVQ